MAHLGEILPLALHLENADGLAELLRRIQASMDSIRLLDDDETGLLSEFIYRILLPMARGAGTEAWEQFTGETIGQMNEGGTDMVSQVSKRIHQEVKGWLQQGREEGILQARRDMVLHMHQNGMPPDQIAQMTDLPAEEVQAILQDGPQPS